MKKVLIVIKVSKDTALALWHKNLNLTRDLTGRVNKPLALQLTHNDIEAIKAKSLTSKGNIIRLAMK